MSRGGVSVEEFEELVVELVDSEVGEVGLVLSDDGAGGVVVAGGFVASREGDDQVLSAARGLDALLDDGPDVVQITGLEVNTGQLSSRSGDEGLGVDLETEINQRVEKNSRRTYVESNGVPVKAGEALPS